MHFEEMKQRYQNDPRFFTLVNKLYALLIEGQLTVGELRDAATLAHYKFEMSNARPPFFEVGKTKMD